MGTSATNRFFQRLSIALATASSQHALSIILNTFHFPPIHVYMFALHKLVKKRFSEGSEAVVLLSVVLSGLPVGIVLLE